jgi:2'-5' RNA ligase
VRLFAALDLPAEARHALGELLRPLRGEGWPISWIPPENLHITLSFLGEVPRAELPRVEASLREGCVALSPFTLVLRGGGAFPTPRSPRVLWVGLGDALESAGRLHQNVSAALSRNGFPGDGKPFHPHVTVGRVRAPLPPGAGERLVGALSAFRPASVPVTAVVLYESRLSPSGARYTPLSAVPLSGGGEDRSHEEGKGEPTE